MKHITAFIASSQASWVLNIACGLFVHIVYNRFEPQPINFQATLFLLLVVPAFPTYVLISTHETSGLVYSSLFMMSLSYAFFYTTLVTSIVVYRLSPFHSLSSFPGPHFLRVSQICPALVCAQGKRHEYFKALHNKYGPYVRVGPNELSCTDASAIPVVLGPTGLPKGPMWESRQYPGKPQILVGLLDFKEHKRRRRMWSNGLNTAAIKGYEESLGKRIDQLVYELSKRARKGVEGQLTTIEDTVNLATWFSHFAFDFMGDMAFGGGFDLMSHGDVQGIWGLLESSLREIAIFQHFPYLMPFLWRHPSATAKTRKVVAFSEECVRKRIGEGSSSKDLFHYLSNENSVESETPSFEQLVSDSGVAIVAGSDTVASTLANVFFHLLLDPGVYARLRNEIDDAFPSSEPAGRSFMDSAKLADLPYLNAVINESLRLHPPVHVNIQRQTLSEGKWIGSRFVPPGTAVNIPPYVIHRDETYFSPVPDKFWPDRWLPVNLRDSPRNDQTLAKLSKTGTLQPKSDDITLNLSAFIPFSYGPANCIGKNLALLEMRAVISAIIRHFDLKFGHDGEKEYDPENWYKDTEDWFVITTGKLPVILTSRV